MRVSVCIPAFESVPKLSRAINSILKQNDVNYEIVVSDDSQSSLVEDYIRGLGHDSIKYLKNRGGQSSTSNWNNALSAAEGDILLLLHHDDYLLKENALSTISQAFLSNNLDLLWSSFENEVGFYRFFSRKFCYNLIRRFPSSLFIVNYLSTPSCMAFKSSVVERYDESLKWYVDVEFYVRCIRRYNCSAFIQDTLIGIGRDGKRISDTIENQEKLDELKLMPLPLRLILSNRWLLNVCKCGFIGFQMICYNLRKWRER